MREFPHRTTASPAVLRQGLFMESTTENLHCAAGRRALTVIIDGPDHAGSPPVRHASHSTTALAPPSRPRSSRHPGTGGLGRRRLDGHVGILFAAAHPDWDLSLIALGAPVHPSATPAGGESSAAMGLACAAGTSPDSSTDRGRRPC